MDLGLKDKTVLVTGSTAGIGLAIATRLACEGANVVINGRSEARVAKAIQDIRASGATGEVRGIAADLGKRAGIDILTDAVPSVDVLVNNLGIFEPKAFEEISDDDWLRFFEVNVLSGVRLSRHYLAGMRQRNWGRIVFISSESAVNIPAEMIHYGVTKTSQLAVARGLAETLVGTQVTVNSILPGPTKSEGVATFVEDLAKEKGQSAQDVEKEFFRSMRPSSLLQRFERPDEIAAMVAYVCSTAASGTNGAALRVDGGVVRSIL